MKLLGREIGLGDALELMARVGYAARGFVYVSVGLIALLAAFEWTDRASGTTGAMAALQDWPFGRLWLTAVAFGLLGFAAWRALQAIFDADREGTRPKALAARVGQAISGLVYGALAFSMFELLDEVEDLNEASEEASAQQSAAEILSLPGGQWLLIAVGLFIAGVGVGNGLKAVFGDFGRRLGCRETTRRWACRLGRIGYFGRGIAFLPLGYTLVRAGLDMAPDAARTLGGALQSLERQPGGSWLLAFVAAGLIAFGLFAFVEARFRRIDVPDDMGREGERVVSEADYEAQAQAELVKWRARMVRAPGPLAAATREFQDSVNRIIPEKVHAAITAAVEQTTRAIITGAGVTTPAPLLEAPLNEREARVRERVRAYRTVAAAEGGVAGAGGFLLAAADFPALILIKLKLLFEIAALYGRPPRDFQERLYILSIFQLAFSSARHRREVFEGMLDWDARRAELPASVDAVDWRRFQQEYRDYIDLAKLAQLLPIVGAPVGAVVNWRLTDRLGETAMNAYRLRWFAGRP